MKRLIAPGGVLESQLSPLEQDVLVILWKHKRMRVREIYKILSTKRKVALSSIAVILDRLHEKKVVGRDIEKGRGGVRYIYFAFGDKEFFERGALDEAVNKLISRFGSTAANYFDERFNKKR